MPKGEDKVLIRFDPNDISAVYVSDPTTGKTICVPAAAQQYTKGLSMWKHKIIKSFVQAEKNEVNIEALAAARAKIQQIVADEYINTRRNRGRKTAARLLNVGTPSVIPDVKEKVNNHSTSDTTNIGTASVIPTVKGKVDDHSTLDTRKNGADSGATQKPSVTPVDDQLGLDMDGWGGDYDLLKSK